MTSFIEGAGQDVAGGAGWQGHVEYRAPGRRSADLGGPPGAGIAGPLVGGDVETAGSSQNSAWVPLPWWTSQSTISTRSPASTSCAAATATLLIRQKPMAWSARAWWPGGRAATKATPVTAILQAPPPPPDLRRSRRRAASHDSGVA